MDFKEVKDRLNVEDVVRIVRELGGECRVRNDNWLVFDSILYHGCEAGMHKPKMYYYLSSCSFFDYKLGDGFDIIELVSRAKNVGLYESAGWICNFCNIDGWDVGFTSNKKYNWQSDILSYVKGQCPHKSLKIYDKSILNKFEEVYHADWLNDGISIESMKKYGIKFYSWDNVIIIPCEDIDGNLIGIRTRTVDKTQDWKYLPFEDFDGTDYAFPTNNALYGLNHTKDAVKKYGKIILVESEKGVLQCDGFFGDKNISAGTYGSKVSEEMRSIILSLDVNEVIIAYDFDYKKIGDELWDKFIDKTNNIAMLFDGFCKVTRLVEYGKHPQKASPSDLGYKRFNKLLRNREVVLV